MSSPAPRFHPRLTPALVAQALGLSLPPAILNSSSIDTFPSVVTDSRKIEKDCLFVCLKGEKFDGHDFIAQALSKGARGIVCRRGIEVENCTKAIFFYVDDTQDAFRNLASRWRREFSCPVVAVAGSVGKTTTKEILAAALSGKFNPVLKTVGSQNGFVGIPMTLLELRASHQAAVIEVGIDEIGAMKQHMDLVSATASVLTAIGPEHLEKLRDIPTVAQEEGLALSCVAQNGGLVAINLDDPWIKPHAKTIRGGNKVTYSFTQKDATLVGRYSPDDENLHVTHAGASETRYPLPLPGAHNATNTLAAIAVATALGLTPQEIREGLRSFKPVSGRSELKRLGNIEVLCDYYNANPTSTEAGLALLSQVADKARSKSRHACLGDMLELGSDEERFHRELASPLIEHEIEHVYLYGPRMQWLADELRTRGFSGSLNHFSEHGPMAKLLAESLKPGDSVLLKGSHGMRMEEIWKSLEAHFHPGK